MLRIENLSVGYGERRVLHDVSLEVRDSEVVALIGPNGAGKSTLIRAVTGVIPVLAGQVRTNGKHLLALDSMSRAKLVSVVPQSVSLPAAFTVQETVLLGRTPYLNFLGQVSSTDMDVVKHALERVDALDIEDRRVGELSGGEQQRVLLARALAQSTPILLLDEPTAHLDLQHQVGLLELVQRLAHRDGLAVLIALHDLNLAARYADRIALLVQGRVRAIGTPHQVLRPDLLSQAYNWPVQVVPHPFQETPLILPESSARQGSGQS